MVFAEGLRYAFQFRVIALQQGREEVSLFIVVMLARGAAEERDQFARLTADGLICVNLQPTHKSCELIQMRQDLAMADVEHTEGVGHIGPQDTRFGLHNNLQRFDGRVLRAGASLLCAIR